MGMFDELLDRTAETIKEPPLLPPGTYVLQVKALPEETETDDWSIIQFQLIVVSVDSADEDAIEAYGKVAGTPTRQAFMFSKAEDDSRGREQSLNRLKTFVQNCGIDTDGMTMREAVAQTPGTQLLGEISHRPDKNDPDKIYLNLDKTHSL